MFGIVDWDGSNVDGEGVFVLGGETRDEIENYIFDPLLLGIFLFREMICSAEDLKLDQKTTYIDVKQLGCDDLQKIVDSVILKVSAKVSPTNLEATELLYVGGYKLRGAQWYLITGGHELQKAVCEAFPNLNDFKGSLPGKLLNMVLGDLPDFVPMDILELFQKIQNG